MIDTEAIAWAYSKLNAFGIGNSNMDSAMMMDRLNGMLAAAPTPPARDSVEIPTSADEAELMLKLGWMWLVSNAPERLKTPPAQQEPVLGFRKWREVWHGASPYKGSSIVDDYTNEPIAYLGGDEGTHAAVRTIVFEHNNEIGTAAKSTDKLRKAAEELIEHWDSDDDAGEISAWYVKNLRAALEGKCNGKTLD